MNLPIQSDEYELIILDADGTIADRDSDTLYPDVASTLRAIAIANPDIKWAIASNQGGVGCRLWMETDGWGDPSKLPTQETVEARFEKLQASMCEAVMQQVYVYTAFAYQSRNGKWGPTPQVRNAEGNFRPTNDERWHHIWRKPDAGMIYAAIKDATPNGHMMHRSRVLVVGDSAEDESAAKSAQVGFMSAAEFFGRGVVISHYVDLPFAGRTIRFGDAQYKAPDLRGCIIHMQSTEYERELVDLGVRIVSGVWSGPKPGEKFWVLDVDYFADPEGAAKWYEAECL